MFRQERENHGYWLQGMYVYDALCCSLKGVFGSSAKYPAQPYPIGKDQQEKNKEIKEENERLAAELYMRNMVRAGKNWKK